MYAPCQLLLLLCILGTASPPAESSCSTLARARGAIPGDALLPRYLLYIFHELTRYDICKNSFQHLPASTFMLEEGMTMGTLVQQWAQTFEDFMWENWVRNYSDEKIKFKWDVDNMINYTMHYWEKEVDFTIRDLKRIFDVEPNITTNEINALFQNYFSFSKDDFAAFVEDLTCHFQGNVKHSELENFIEADGVETINDNNLKELLKTTQNIVLAETSDFLRNMVGKLRLLLEKFQPEMKTYENTILKLQSGNTLELENLIFRILQEIQTDEFLQRLDTFGRSACFKMRYNTGRYTTNFFMHILSSLEELSKVVGSYVNKNNKLDLQSLVIEFNTKFGEIVKTCVNDILDSTLAEIEVGLKNVDYVFQIVNRYLPIVFSACGQFETCQKESEILIEQADVLVGGAFRAFVKKFGKFGKVLECEVDCTADCPDVNGDSYDPDGPQDSRFKMCMSKMGCNKNLNLFYDPEC